MAGNTVRIRAVLDDKVSSGLDKIRDNFDRLGKNKGAQSVLQGVGVGAGISAFNLLGSAVGGVESIVLSSIDAASAMNETISKTEVVFGRSAAEVKAWGDTSAKSMGISTQAALEQASTLGNLFLSMGKTSDQAAKMSTEMVQLAADLGSFNNVDPEEVLLAMRSGLTGEIAPLRRFGVNLTEATLKAKAMELGLSDGVSVLDASAKSSAAYALILEQTKTAQGDFARTAGGMANQQKILNAELQNASAELGESLIPFVIEAQRDIIQMADAASILRDALKEANKETGGFTDKLVTMINTGFRPDALLGFATAINDTVQSVVSSGDKAAKAWGVAAGDFREDGRNIGTTFADVGAAANQNLGKDIPQSTVSALDAFNTMVHGMVSAADDLIDKAYDPLIEHEELLADEVELATLKQIASKRKLTAEERKRLTELQKSEAQHLVALAEAGQTSSKAFKTGIADLRTQIRNSTGPTKVYLQGVLDKILAIKKAGRNIPLNIVINTLGGQISGTFDPKEGAASGGQRSGLTLVGEKGPEIVDMGSGAYVYNNAETNRILAGSGGGGSPVGGSMTVIFQSTWPPTKEQARDIARVLDEAQYSSVQSAAAFNGRV